MLDWLDLEGWNLEGVTVISRMFWEKILLFSLKVTLQDNFPKMGITQLDLSPFYLAKARENMDYWRSKRGGSNPADSVAHKDKFLHAPAEQIPVPDSSYNIVSAAVFNAKCPSAFNLLLALELLCAL